MSMSVKQLKELLNQFDDKARIVVKVETEDTQDNDYAYNYEYENILGVKDVGYNLVAINIPFVHI